MSAVPPPGDATQQAATPAPAKKSLNNEKLWKIGYILSQIIPETGRALAPDRLEKPFSSERWTIAPANIQYRNSQALAKKKTLGVSHRTILKVAMGVLLLAGAAASIFFTIHGLVAFSVLTGVAILFLQLVNKLYFLKDPPASSNPHYLEGESVELVTRRQGGDPAGAGEARARAEYEQRQKGAPEKHFPTPSAPPMPKAPQPGKQTSQPLKAKSSGEPKQAEDTRWFDRDQMIRYTEKLAGQYTHYLEPRHNVNCEIPADGRLALDTMKGRTAFYKGTQNVAHEVIRDIEEAKKKGKTILGYPLHISGNHWSLLVVDLTQRTVEYYDSKEDDAAAVAYLKKLAKHLGYKFIPKIKDEIQPDSHQCGPWALFFLEARLKKPNFHFGALTSDDKHQMMIREYRKHVLAAIAQP